MHYVTRRYHHMQKHKFSIICPDAFLWNPYQSHPSNKNSASMFRAPDAPTMSYLSRRSHRMQKYKFSITCPSAFFWNLYRSHTSIKICVSIFRTSEAPECTT
jgi:hypothetical protein